MNLQGLKITFLGDSITEGHGCSSEETRFTSLIASQHGAITRCYGIGGTRLARQTKPSEWPRHDLDFPSRGAEMDPDAALIVVFGGTNDFGHGDAPLGTPADRDESTFYGAYHVLLNKIFERYPGAEVVLMTPLHRLGDENCTYNEFGMRRSANLEGYAEAIKEIAKFYSVPVLDLFTMGGLNPIVPVQKELFMPDGLHPNDAGHARIAQRLIGLLNTL